MTFNEELQHHIIDLMVDIIGISGASSALALTILETMRQDIESALAERAINADKLALNEQKALLKEIDSITSDAIKSIGEQLPAEIASAGQFAQDRFYQVFDGMGVSLGQPIFTKQDIEVLAKNNLLDGVPLKDWISKLEQDTVIKMQQAVRLGILNNETIPQIVNRLVGTKTGGKTAIQVQNGRTRLIPTRVGGIQGITRNSADGLARTAVNSFGNEVLYKIYGDNTDVIKGVQAVITLDLRTSDICRPRQGWAWDIETGKPIPTYNTAPIDFPGPPAWHFRCRSVLAPITYSWAELSGVEGIPEVNDGLRASMDGQVSDSITYDDWLRQKEKRSPGSIEKVLGPTKGALFRSGKADMVDFVNAIGQPKSIAELRREYGLPA